MSRETIFYCLFFYNNKFADILFGQKLTPNSRDLSVKLRSDIPGYFAYSLPRLFASFLSPVLTRISSASVHASINSSRRYRKLRRKFDLHGAQAEHSVMSSYAIFLREHPRRCVKSLPRETESACRAPTAISSRRRASSETKRKSLFAAAERRVSMGIDCASI